MTTPSTARVRHRLHVRGVVQGVGFRPFVHRLATALDLSGHVGNDGHGVFVEVEGPGAAIVRFEDRLVREAPPLARVEAVESAAIALREGEAGFRIVASRVGRGVTLVAPDTAVCDDCLLELFDPADRRFRYPFITCTNCGPRASITLRLPYDRPNTTMASFVLCPLCQVEYEDPADRRFHAQPLACPECGPRLWFDGPEGRVDGTDDALAASVAALAAGQVVAVKGLGGYHLACDPRSDAAVSLLRERKGRVEKPFALMARDLAVVRRYAEVDEAEAALLTSSARPIVLLVGRPDAGLSGLVAPGNPQLGVMLPYTPVHHLLLQAPGPDVVVMTSGNVSEEPIAYDDDDARGRLTGLADAWLVHDRPIHVPYDDSVLRVVDGGEALPIRRSRGYAPLPVALPVPIRPTLAVGGELKTTFCLASGSQAWLSQHIGDMGSVETLAAFERSVTQFSDLYGVAAEALVADQHPAYQTRAWAERRGSPRLVQHHHAHVAAVMAEHGVPPGTTVLGAAFDGTGYGADGTIWGGEVLVATYARAERVAHLAEVPLPGGDAAIRRPYRTALAHLWSAGIPWDPDLPPVAAATPEELAVLRRQLDRNVQCVPTSSMGRLFDAVASLLGLPQRVTYEAQAAMALEHLPKLRPPTPLCDASSLNFGKDFDAGPVLHGIVADLRRGVPGAAIAAEFHAAIASHVRVVAEAQGIPIVALTGGVFQNALLLRLTRGELGAAGFTVLTHRVVPPNDGGLALGQIAVAAAAGLAGEGQTP